MRETGTSQKVAQLRVSCCCWWWWWYCTAGEATDKNMAPAHCILDTCSYRHALKICNTSCSSIATIASGTRLNVTSYVHCLSCLNMLSKFLTPVPLPQGLRRRSAATRLLRLWVRIPPETWMLECCVSSGRGLGDEPITRPEESYRLRSVVVYDLQTSRMTRPWPTGGGEAVEPKRKKS